LRLTNPQLNELDREKQVGAYLVRVRKFLVTKHDSVGIYDQKIQKFRKSVHPYRRTGVSDYLSWMPPNARGLTVEIKTPEKLRFIEKNYPMLQSYCGTNKDYQRYRKQIEWIEDMKKIGGVGFFTDSVEDCEAKLLKHGVITEADCQFIRREIAEASVSKPIDQSGATVGSVLPGAGRLNEVRKGGEKNGEEENDDKEKI
jgi:hypothetical protein